MAVSLKRGSAIGRYVVLGLIGRGAMGEVYAAYDPDLDRKVAVKLLHAEAKVGSNVLSSQESRARLLREAQAIARLSHPNVIVVHDAGNFADRVFVAMEFVDGHTVGYWLQAAARPWKEVLSVFLSAGRGLSAAHAAQLVHRDFKPENVMVGRDGQVRVMDFGLARRLSGDGDGFQNDGGFNSATDLQFDTSDPDDAEATVRLPSIAPSYSGPISLERVSGNAPVVERGPVSSAIVGSSNSGDLALPILDGLPTQSVHTSLTQTGAVMGTPAYMSPEQFMGRTADARSDQFSFCVALYEGLYGERPFAAKSIRGLAEAVTNGRLRGEPESSRIPSWIRKVIVRGLHRNPHERWPSMEALLAALERDPRARFRRRAAAVFSVVAIAGVVALIRHQTRQEFRPSCQVGAERFDGVWESATKAGGRRREIAGAFAASQKPYAGAAFTGLSSLMDKYVRSWSDTYRDACEATYVRGEQSADLLDLRMSCLRERWSELQALSTLFSHPDGDAISNAVKAAAALTPVDRCNDIRVLKEAVPPPTNPEVRRRVEALASQLAANKAVYDAGQFAKALASAAQLVSNARTVGYPPALAESLYRLALSQIEFERGDDAEKNLDEAIWLAQASHLDELAARAAIFQIYAVGVSQNDVSRARWWKRQSEALLSRIGGHQLERSWMMNHFGAALDAHGDTEDALESYREALKIKEGLLGPSDPDVAVQLTNLVGLLTTLGRYTEALELANRGVDIVTATLGSDHGLVGIHVANRAEVLNHLGRFSDAKRDADHAREIFEREAGPEHTSLSFVYELIGEAALGLEQPTDAIEALEHALSLAESSGDEPQFRSVQFALARALWESGKNPQRARTLAAAASAPVSPSSAPSNRAFTLPEQKLRQEATAWLAGHPELPNGRTTADRKAISVSRGR